MQVSKFREIQKKDGKYKKTAKKKHILRLFGEGSIEKIKNTLRKPKKNKTNKKKQKIQKSKTIDPMGHHVTRVQT
jgi:hypothetical protein